MAERFAGQLARGIWRDRRENRVLFRKRHFGIDAVHRRRRTDGHFLYASIPRRFEQVDCPFDIDPLVNCRISQAGPHTGPGRQMDHLIKLRFAEHFVYGAAICDVSLHEREWFGQCLEHPHILLLDGRRVERIEVIERPNRMTHLQQPLTNVRPNEACAAGDQKIHRRARYRSAARVQSLKFKVAKGGARVSSPGSNVL